VARELRALSAAGVRAFAVGGNHDTPRTHGDPGAASPLALYHHLGALRLLQAEGAIDDRVVEVEGVRVAVGGRSWDPLWRPGQDPLEGLDWRPEADVRILLLHASLEGHRAPQAEEPVVRWESVARLDGVHVLAVGHVHRFARFRIGETTVVVPGATERMTFGDDEGEPGFVFLELDAAGRVRQLQHVAVPAQPRREAVVRAEDLDEEDPSASLLARIEPLCDPEALVRVRLVGLMGRRGYHALDLPRAHQYGQQRCFFFDLDATGLALEDEATPGGGLRIAPREELVRYAEELLAATVDERQRALLWEARQMVLAGYDAVEDSRS